MRSPRRLSRFVLLAAAGLSVAGCTSDPAFWNAVATGLDEAAADIAQENAGCYWAPPPGQPYGANQRYCPGDYGYRDVYPLPASYYRDRYRDDRGGHRHRGRDRDDRDGERRGDRRGKG
jgi:hypothetical protein